MKMGGLGKGEKVRVKMYVYGVWTKVCVNEKSSMGTQNIGNYTYAAKLHIILTYFTRLYLYD